MSTAEETKIKLFDKYTFDNVEVYSKSLQAAISIKPNLLKIK
ncbi:MAG: hypothetical protein QXP88_02280 [Thermoproteota archaeon]